MKLGIMQPYFFPYLGYFQLINLTDKWIVFDDVNYIKRGWMNRNRVLKPERKDWQYIRFPVKKFKRGTKIKDIEIKNDLKWKDKIFRQLEHYKNIAPYYANTIKIVENSLEIETKSLTKLNSHILKTVCDYLEIDFNYSISSNENYDYSQVEDADEWALEISKQEKANKYINPIGGKDFFDPKKYKKNNIDINFLEIENVRYSQKNNEFISNLSIIDILMFNSKKETKNMLTNYKLVD